MAKQIVYGEDARKALQAGIDRPVEELLDTLDLCAGRGSCQLFVAVTDHVVATCRKLRKCARVTFFGA